MYSRPDKPQQDIARVYPYTEHGKTVYITKEEYSRIKWLGYIGPSFILIEIIYIILFHPFKNDSV
jgi:hypothetical protein